MATTGTMTADPRAAARVDYKIIMPGMMTQSKGSQRARFRIRTE